MSVTILAGAAVTLVLDGYYRSELLLQAERQLARSAKAASQQLTRNMERRIAAIEDLRAFMLADTGLPGFEAFDHFAANLREHYPSIDSLVYVDEDLVIRHIHPPEKHKDALGLDLKRRPSAPVIQRAIRERRLIVDSPHPIIGGQTAFLARAPLFRDEHFLGLAQGIFIIPEILAADLNEVSKQYDIQLTDSNGKLFGVRRKS